MKKRILSLVLCVCCVMFFCVPAFAATSDNVLTYELSCDNGSTDVHDIQVSSGDTITVAYTITASARSVTSTTQDQIIYDYNFFELVDGSISKETNYAGAFQTSNPIETDGTHYILYNSTSNVTFKKDEATKIGTFKLKVIATSGSSTITNNEYFATDSSADLFGSAKQDLKVTIGGEPPTPPQPTEIDIPTATTGLTYNGVEQTGVAAGTGYTVENGKATNAGSYTATAKLKAGYTWSDGTEADKEISWSIAQAELTSATAQSQECTGSKLTPVLTVKAGTLTLASTDYELSAWDPSGLTDIGTYTATVTGKGNFTGEKTVTFEITPKGTVNTPVPVPNLKYTGNEQTGVAAGTGYTVANGKKINAGDYKATAKLEAGYTWSDGTTDDKEIDWSIGKATIDTASAASQEYTGSTLTPALTVKAGSLDATYDLGAWSGNLKDIGTYTATVTGNGNFTGEKTVTFEITPKGIVNTPTPVPNLKYTGLEQTGVADGTGYTVTGNKATDAGNYTATATLEDGYKWSDGTTTPKEIKWSIGQAEITSASAASQEYTGSVLTPILTVKAGSLDATYDLGAWSGNLKDIGTYTATVTGNGNFTGEKTVTFEITHTHSNGQLQPGTPAQEFEPGFKDYYKCKCGDFFEDATCLVRIGDAEDLEAWKAPGGRGYIPRTHKHGNGELQQGEPAEEFKDGFKDYYKCPGECGELFEDETCLIPIEDFEAWKAPGGRGNIPQLHEHTLELCKGTPAKVNEPGCKDYYKCQDENCNKFFEDAAGTIEIKDLDKWKAKGGNGYIEPLPDKPRTGDNNNIALWIVLLMLSLSVSSGIVVIYKRKKSN